MIELLSNAEMAAADTLATRRGIDSLLLMENAGCAVAAAVAASCPRGERIGVVAGPGNNGGDGFVAARVLAERGYHVTVALLGELSALKGDCAAMARKWAGAVTPAGGYDLTQDSVLVDALFGAGLDRPLEGQARAVVERMNASGRPIVAVDLPSGINGTTGEVMGAAVRAGQTVTFFRRKWGHVLLPGRLHCGPVAVADIGIPAGVLDDIAPRTFVNGRALWISQFPVPAPDTHKYQRGHVVAIVGPIAFSGAGRLAALGALRAGAGLVTMACPRETLAVAAATSPSLMVRAADSSADLQGLLADPRINAVVIGPGGGAGPDMRAKVAVALTGKRAAVLDADALTSFVDEPKNLFTMLATHPDSPAILTPHEGEFRRIFSKKSQKPPVKQKLEETREASHEAAAVIVRKGADTIIAAPDGRAAINENAPPWLATAGAGDVLAGIIAGLRAQGMPAFEAACAGVWIHGEAGKALGPGLISQDLPGALPAIYRSLYARAAPLRMTTPGSDGEAD